jgi:hypothetical protein
LGYGRVTFERLATMLLFLAIGAAACFAPAQSDTWWQLRTGQEIWTTGTVQLSDHFSYTVAGNYWPNHEWLSQLLFYAGYRAGGMPLLTALTASIIVGAWFLIWRLTPGGYPRKHLVCALAVIPSSMAWALRPQVFTLFLVAATALLVARRRYLLLPILFLLWANLHGGVMLGFVILASGVLALLVENRRWPLAARGESPAAFERRCIPPPPQRGCRVGDPGPGRVAPPSNIPDILGRRALPAGRLVVLGATPDVHHGL